MGFFDRLKKGLTKTRENFTHNIERLIIGYAALEFIKDGKNGYLMKELNKEELASKLNKALKLNFAQVALYDRKLMGNYNLEGAAKNIMDILEGSHV